MLIVNLLIYNYTYINGDKEPYDRYFKIALIPRRHNEMIDFLARTVRSFHRNLIY